MRGLERERTRAKPTAAATQFTAWAAASFGDKAMDVAGRNAKVVPNPNSNPP